MLSLWLSQQAQSQPACSILKCSPKFAGWSVIGGSPLYLKTHSKRRGMGHSFALQDQTTLAADDVGIIRQFFARLSDAANHGLLLVIRSLGYLGAAKQGRLKAK